MWNGMKKKTPTKLKTHMKSHTDQITIPMYMDVI